MSVTALYESYIHSLCYDTLWGSETQDDQHKERLGPYFEFCTHLFKDLVEKTPRDIRPPSGKKKYSPSYVNFGLIQQPQKRT